MSQRNIDFGSFPDDPSADAIRTAFEKVQQNFTELYTGTGAGVTSVVAGQGIELGGTGASTGTVVIEADIACIQVQTSTLSLGVLGSSSDESYVLIPSSSQILTIDLPANLTIEDLELSGNLEVQGNTTLGNSVTANFFIGDGGLLSNLTVSGGSSIDNGTSNVVVDANGNVRTSVAGTSNVLTVTSTGANVSGYMTATGNVTANYFIGNGSLLTGIATGTPNSIVNGTSNVTVTANANVNVSVAGNSNIVTVTGTGANVSGYVDVTGNVTAAFFIGDGGLLSNISGLGTGNTIENGTSNVVVDANGNVRTSVAGVANVLVVTSSGANVTGNMSISGNASIGAGSGGNITGANVISANTVIAALSANLGNSATANFFIGDGGLLSNISGTGSGNAIINGNSNVTVTANSNVTVSVAGNSNIVTVTDTGANISGYVDVTGNVTAAFFIGDGGLLSNITVAGGTSITNGNSNVVVDANSDVRTSVAGVANVLVVTSGSANVTGNLSVSGNTTLGNGSGGNLSGANVISANTLIAALSANLGNSATANFFIGDGGLLSNISGIGSGNSITNGTSNVVVDANANVRVSVAGVSDVLTVTNTDLIVAGNIIPSTNLTFNLGNSNNRFNDLYLSGNTIYLGELVLTGESNDLSISGNLSALNASLGNLVSANFFQGDGGLLSNVTAGSPTSITNGSSNIQVDSSGNVRTSVAGNSNIFTVTGTGSNIAGNLDVTGNITAYDIASANAIVLLSNTEGSITGANSISANFFYGAFFGDGGGLSNVGGASGNQIFNGTSNVVVLPSGNVTTSIAGNPNITVATSTGFIVNGVMNVIGNANTSNFNASGLMVATGNVTGGNILTAGTVTASRLISNVAQGTAPFAVSSNTLVANLNANLLNNLTTTTANTGTTIAQRFSNGALAATAFVGNISSDSANQSNITGLGNLTSLIVTGNITGGNLSSAGRLSITGAANSNVGNLGANLLVISGNLTSGNANLGNIVVANYLSVSEDLTVVGNTIYGGGSGGTITGANVISANTLIAALSANLGNSATANFFIGDGGLLSNISGTGSSNAITNGTSNVVVDANSDVRTSVAGVANVLVVTSSGANVTGNTALTSLGVGTAASGTSGEIRATNNITAYYSSDRRLKENVQPITDPIKKVMQLSGVTFDWTDAYIQDKGGEDGFFVRKNDIGVIAQEVQKVLPEIVAEREDGMLAVKYEKMVALLLEAIKEQNTRIEKLEETIATLTGNDK